MERFERKVISASVVCRIVVAAIVGTTLGCGKGESTESTTADNAENKPTVASATPEEAIHEFMMAFKTGDEAKAAELVTQKTRQEMERTQYGVSPPGTKDMEYKVGAVQYVADAKDLARVACHVTDLDEVGQKKEVDLVWFLRKESAGWRVAGVAMEIFADQLPVLYNFEDMDDMERKVKMVNEEMDRRDQVKFEQAKATLMQAQQPPDATIRQQ